MTDSEAALRRAWQALTFGDPVSAEIIDDLIRRYAEPHRRYHTADHIVWVLRHIDDLLNDDLLNDDLLKADLLKADEFAADRDVLVASALFHDAVYDSHPTADALTGDVRTGLSNEAQSARLAVAQLSRMGWDDIRVAEVAALIEATATHLATTPESAILLDADLAILGADPVDYLAYVVAVRAEYDHVDDEQWRVGRAAVLHNLLARPHIFATPAMASQREHQARANMAGELAELEARGTV
jgi:predicted metal-dependent HD superfamily phosphohydrolase